MAGSDILVGAAAANSVTVISPPCESRSSMARRVGSDSAEKIVSKDCGSYLTIRLSVSKFMFYVKRAEKEVQSSKCKVQSKDKAGWRRRRWQGFGSAAAIVAIKASSAYKAKAYMWTISPRIVENVENRNRKKFPIFLRLRESCWRKFAHFADV